MPTFTTILLTMVVMFGAIYLLASEFLDIIGRLEVIEKRWPKVLSAMSNRPMRLVLLILLLVLIARDLQERLQAKVPVLLVTMPSIAVPQILAVTPTEKRIQISKAGESLPPSLPVLQMPIVRPIQPSYTQNTPQPNAQTAFQAARPHEQLSFGETPYGQVTMVGDGLRGVQGQWQQHLHEIDVELATPFKFEGRQGLMPTTMPDDIVQKLLEVDERSSKQYEDMTRFIEEARRNASSLLKLTPNQETKDAVEFTNADQSARARPTIADLRLKRINGARYSKIITYFENLKKQVGDQRQP